jgi:hypothetical protein
MTRYDVILAGRWSFGEVVESVTLDEALDEIAMRATVDLVVTADFPGIEPGQALRVVGPAGQLFDGVVWECDSVTRGVKHLAVIAYDRTIYLAKSEDEYLFPAGQTATQRLKRYAADWSLALGAVAETAVPLAAAVYRAQPIYSMIRSDLLETARKGGELFRARMAGLSLELVRLGSNDRLWVLATDSNVSEVGQRRTLEGACTRAKVLGEATDEAASPVLALADGDRATLGTLQKVVQDSAVTTPAEAATRAKLALAGVQESLRVTALGVETVRAGDKVLLDGTQRLVTSVRHRLGAVPESTLELASYEYVRRNYYD